MIFSVSKNGAKYRVSTDTVSIECDHADDIGKVIVWMESYPNAPHASSPSNGEKAKTRKAIILECLAKQKRPMTVNEILDAVGASRDEVRNFSSTCLGLFEAKQLKRVRNEQSIYAYSLR